jgi:TonB family protein
MEHPILSYLLGGALLPNRPLPDVLFFLLSFNGKAFVLLAGSFFLLKLTKGSAANRHLLVTVSLVAIFLLPLTSGMLPVIHIPITVDEPSLANLPTSIHVVSTSNQPAPDTNTVSILPWLIVAYFSGTAIILLRILWGNFAMLLLKHLSTPVNSPRWQHASQRYRRRWGIRRSIQVRHSNAVGSPLTWGVLRPVVLIPTSALDWPEHLIKSTLLHEFAHIRRCDWLIKQFARSVCAFYWINPQCWKALRKLSASAEAACDDMVISSGLKSTRYAADLVNVAKQIKQQRDYSLATVGMSATAESTDLGYRVRAILNPLTSHTPNTALRIVITYALVMCLFFPLSSLRASFVSSLPEESLPVESLNETNTASNLLPEPVVKATKQKDEKQRTPLPMISIGGAEQKIVKTKSIKPEKNFLKGAAEKPISTTQTALKTSLKKPPINPLKNPLTKKSVKNTAPEKAPAKADGKALIATNKVSKTLSKPAIDVSKSSDRPEHKLDKIRTEIQAVNTKSMNNTQLVGNTEQHQPSQHLQDVIDHFISKEESALPELEYIPVDQPLLTKAVIEPYSRQRMIKPSYPRRAIRKGIEGEVTVQFDIDANGNVVRPEVINAHPSGIFDISVLKAIKRYLFNPQRINGEAVGVQGVQEKFTFVLQS